MDVARNMRRQAGLLVELVNLAVPGTRQGSQYQPPDSAEVRRRFGELLTEPTARRLAAAPDAARRLTALAHELHAVLAAPDIEVVVKRLNTVLARCRAQPYLTNDDNQPYHLHFHGTAGHFVDALGGEFATALALVIDTMGEDRFGVCQAHTCDRVYVDLTRNGGRRYCGNGCASRAKTAAYRARQR